MFDLDRYVNESFGEVKVSGDERIVTCFWCGKRGKLYINVVKRKVYCFRCGAGQGATLVSFLRDHRGVSEGEALNILRSNRYYGHPVQSYVEAFAQTQYRTVREQVLPEEYEPLYPRDDESVLAARAIAYLRTRGLTDADLLLYRLGYCATGRYRHRIIVPVLREKEIVYFVGRLFFGFGKRYLNPAHDEVPEHPSNLLFNWDTARYAQTLQVTEGVFDGIGLGDSATALLGKRVHEGQLRLLELGTFKAIEVWLDSPAKDALINESATAIAYELRQLGKPVTICTLEHGDPGDLRVEPDIPVERRTTEGFQDYMTARMRGRR